MDQVLEDMADELRGALRASGIPLDSHPALNESRPPGVKVWHEYKKRGGSVQDDPNQLVDALIDRVKNPA